MGCDIHAIIERQIKYTGHDGEVYLRRWRNAGTPDLGRDYELFAALAGVRNYTGVTPLSEPRGLPGVEGVYEDGRGFKGDWGLTPCSEFEYYSLHWGADAHSASWATLAEIKAYDVGQVLEDPSVVVGRGEDGTPTATAMSSYRDGVDITRTLERVGSRTIFKGAWHKEGNPTAWDSLIAEMERAKRDGDTDDDIRLVFFFDN